MKEKLIFIASLFALTALAGNSSNKNAVHEFTDQDRQWWAIQPLNDPNIPKISNFSALRNPIDNFVFKKLNEADFDKAQEADPYELVRRAYFDLHGLPPSPAQVAEFIKKSDVDFESAYSALIDTLLASPRYGERWAQHWLDVVRYAETDGYRADDYRPDAWRYRDYVINSLNDDKPYDQFVREQLAGDEIDPNDPDTIIGTAFLRHGIYEWNQRNSQMHWELIVNEMTNVTGEVFLGLGIGCAQCHDHKFDPILQKDYYALQSFLATSYWPDNLSLGTPDEKERYKRGQAKWMEKTKTVRDAIDRITQDARAKKKAYTVGQFPPDIQEMYYKPESERTPYEFQMAELVRRQVVTQDSRIQFEKEFQKQPETLVRYKELVAELETFQKDKPKPLPMAFVTTDASTLPVETTMKTRRSEQKVEPAFLKLLGLPSPKIQSTDTTTGRRSALANWITSPENPLSTRVIANRVWHYHFGTGIVPTPNDFGTLGEEPSHPDLLDWLTNQLIENDWQLKSLHRLIMSSATYRQTARREPDASLAMADPENRLLWRFPPQRLNAEQARDAMLVASGEISHRIGGPSEDGETLVRSIYLEKRRNRPEKMLHNFDSPHGFDSAPQRLQTTTPIQSLLLVNSEWPIERANAFAERILEGSITLEPSHISKAISIAYNRPATDREIDLSMQFVKSQIERLSIDIEQQNPIYDYTDTPLSPIEDHFELNGPSLISGNAALTLKPDTPYERMILPELDLTGDSFSFEAVVSLDSIHTNARVNTIVSQWNGDHEGSGWSIGITSAKSKYDPRNFIVQLIGNNGVGNQDYEVVASGLRVPLGKPVYLAVVVTANRIQNESGGGKVVFYMKDLSDPKAELQSTSVSHTIANHIHPSGTPIIVGGRHAEGHLWTGHIARLSLTNRPLGNEELSFSSDTNGSSRINLSFFLDADSTIPDGASWILPDRIAQNQDPILGAVADFCHALMTSNAFLYLH